jgi:hypothetical protein
MKKLVWLSLSSCMMLLFNCSPTGDFVPPSAVAPTTELTLNEGSDQLMLRAVYLTTRFEASVAHSKMRFKKGPIDQTQFLNKAKGINFDNRAELIAFLSETSYTPELFADYLIGLRSTYRELAALNPALVSAKKEKVQQLLTESYDEQVVTYSKAPQNTAFTWIPDSFSGPGDSGGFGYDFRHQTPPGNPNQSVDEQASQGDGNANSEDWGALGICTRDCDIKLQRCGRDFAIATGAAFTTAAVVPIGGPLAGAAGEILALITLYNCREDGFTDLENCVRDAGFYAVIKR